MLTRVIEDFGTAYVHTTVIHTATDGFVWIRGAGIDRPTPLGTAPDQLRPLFHDLPGPVTVQVEHPSAESTPWRAFPAPGPVSIAKHLLLPGGETPEAGPLFEGTGRMLSALHSIDIPAGVRLPTPRGPARLLRWLEGGDGPRATHRLREETSRYLGSSRLRTLRDWCAELGRGSADRTGVLLHGAPGQGVLIPSSAPGADRAAGTMLTGEELAVGPAEFDLGWLVGELIEFRETAPRTDIGFQELIDLLLKGYGPVADPGAVARYALLRILLHAHDFCAYVCWHDSVRAQLAVVARGLDADPGGLLAHPLGTRTGP